MVEALYVPRTFESILTWNTPKEGPVGPKMYIADPISQYRKVYVNSPEKVSDAEAWADEV